MNGLVFNIQRFSIHDGPGIRTTVFLQGCNLRCFWCHNPESQPRQPVVQFFPEKCILCGQCVDTCAEGAQQIEGGRRVYSRERCQACGRCIEACYARALTRPAREMSVDETLAEIHKDRDYYLDSGGGVTFSGGEPFLQKDFLLELLRASKQAGFHTAVDTAGNVPYEWLAEAAPWTDLFLYDCKVIDEQRHREVCGASNRLILANLSRLAGGGARVWVRVPVVPGVNDSDEAIGQIGDFLTGLAVEQVELLPFHHLGAGKYESLDLPYPGKDLKPPGEQQMAAWVALLEEKRLPARRMV